MTFKVFLSYKKSYSVMFKSNMVAVINMLKFSFQ